MKPTFRVKNFERFQHYKDRSPVWIKLYNDLLDDYDFCALPDASKMHLIAIWLLASRSKNKVPYDPEWIARRISATSPVDLEGLVEAGFIELNQPLQSVEQSASNTLAKCLPREEKRREEKNAPDADASHSEIVSHETPDARFFRRCTEVLGDGGRSLGAKLLKSKDRNVALAASALELASTKANPREYLGAIIRGREQGADKMASYGSDWG